MCMTSISNRQRKRCSIFATEERGNATIELFSPRCIATLQQWPPSKSTQLGPASPLLLRVMARLGGAPPPARDGPPGAAPSPVHDGASPPPVRCHGSDGSRIR
jgi:hypothetical protein